MVWCETSTMDQKVLFISDYLRERDSMAELCRFLFLGGFAFKFSAKNDLFFGQMAITSPDVYAR